MSRGQAAQGVLLYGGQNGVSSSAVGGRDQVWEARVRRRGLQKHCGGCDVRVARASGQFWHCWQVLARLQTPSPYKIDTRAASSICSHAVVWVPHQRGCAAAVCLRMPTCRGFSARHRAAGNESLGVGIDLATCCTTAEQAGWLAGWQAGRRAGGQAGRWARPS